METLAILGIVFIVVVALGLQHFVGWLIREAVDDENAGGIAILLVFSLILLVVSHLLAAKFF